ncbi:MAG TPA: ROK family protein [Candidatus Omnitrophota bacterium]|nr:ROK family protein [Candidatus Omnitrophota bacterium]HQO57181.1 ROK family protein [Candidatus Omnitrophota bacterium]HQP11327.1 ROK family protein [Candidatus Omnitrophota bacterium]
MNKIIIGIDVGGTNTKCGLVDRRGQVLARARVDTRKYISKKSLLFSAIVDTVESLVRKSPGGRADILGVGMGLPGLIDTENGVVKILPNIPGWRNVPLKRMMEDKLGLPVRIENDVNLITLGEWKYGAGIGCRNLVCMTLGTGVGSGLILDNRLYRGEGFAAGEIGHMPLGRKGPSCNCGGYACFERYVGNAVLLKNARKLFRDKTMTLEQVSCLASRKDRKALAFWRETAVMIGDALTGVVNLLNPKMIIIGGGVANAHRFLFKTISDTIRARAMTVQGAMFKIKRAQLGDDAGLLGARVLVDNPDF